MAVSPPPGTTPPIPAGAPLIHIRGVGGSTRSRAGAAPRGRKPAGARKQGRFTAHRGSGKRNIRGDGTVHQSGIYVVNGKMVFGAAAYTFMTGLLPPSSGSSGLKAASRLPKHHKSGAKAGPIHHRAHARQMFVPANNPSGSLPGQLMPAGPKVNGHTGHRSASHSKTAITPLQENTTFFGVNSPAPHIPAPPAPHLPPIRTF